MAIIRDAGPQVNGVVWDIQGITRLSPRGSKAWIHFSMRRASLWSS